MATASCGDDSVAAAAAAANITSAGGIHFDPCDPLVILWYSLANIVVTSVIPVPLAGPMTAVAAVLFGLFYGMVINVLTSTVGGYLGLLAVRYLCRPCFMRALGRYRKHWMALDAALLEQGSQIALLIRIAPISPMVATNILLSLTSISAPTYMWTCAIGIIPANLPYAYAAQLGVELATDFPPKDPVMLSMTLFGLIASILIAYKVGMIAKRLLKKAGVGGGSPAQDVDAPLPPAAEASGDETAAEPDAVADEAGARSDQRAGSGSSMVSPSLQPDLDSHDKTASGRKKAVGKARGARAFHSLNEDDGL